MENEITKIIDSIVLYDNSNIDDDDVDVREPAEICADLIIESINKNQYTIVEKNHKQYIRVVISKKDCNETSWISKITDKDVSLFFDKFGSNKKIVSIKETTGSAPFKCSSAKESIISGSLCIFGFIPGMIYVGCIMNKFEILLA
jgi:hypothetical protein